MTDHEPREKARRARAPGHAGDAAERIHSMTGDGAGERPAGNLFVETDQFHALTSDEPTGSALSLRHLTVDADDLGDIVPGANDEDQ